MSLIYQLLFMYTLVSEQLFIELHSLLIGFLETVSHLIQLCVILCHMCCLFSSSSAVLMLAFLAGTSKWILFSVFWIFSGI